MLMNDGACMWHNHQFNWAVTVVVVIDLFSMYSLLNIFNARFHAVSLFFEEFLFSDLWTNLLVAYQWSQNLYIYISFFSKCLTRIYWNVCSYGFDVH